MQSTIQAANNSAQAQTAQEVFHLIKHELALVEEEFERQLRSNIQIISHIGNYLREAGGKRVRPALLLLAVKLCGAPVNRSAIRLSAVMEFIHTATLVHDDIIDNADMRRGRPSVNAEWGNEITVLMGDWLYMSAFEATLKERNFEILDILTNMTRRMTEGELVQLVLRGRLDVTEEQHLDIVRCKTAYLFSACAEVGAILGGATREQQQALRDYGLYLGIAFQLIDDVLDFTSTEKRLGKPVVNDLREGKLTLPLIYLLEIDSGKYERKLQTIMQKRLNGFDAEEVIALVKENGTLKRAELEAHKYAEMARQTLSVFPDSEVRQVLLKIPDYIVERDR